MEAHVHGYILRGVGYIRGLGYCYGRGRCIYWIGSVMAAGDDWVLNGLLLGNAVG